MPGNIDNAILALNQNYFRQHPKNAAHELEDMDAVSGAQLLSTQPVDVAAGVFERLPMESATAILKNLPERFALSLMEQADPKTIAALLHPMSAKERKQYLDHLDKSVQIELTSLLTFEENSAGRLMDTRVPRFRETLTVTQALEKLRQSPPRSISTLFLTDEDQQLTGRVELRDLALAEPGKFMRDIARPVIVVVETLTPQEEVVDLLEKHHLQNLPVVDGAGTLVGVIWEDTLVQAVEDEATVDMQTMVGASREERALSKATFAVRKRQPWLQINLVTAFLAAAVVGLFEDTIARNTALAVLLPVVAGQSGNTGAQALAVTMRGLAVREITLRHWLRVMWKEVNAGFINGIGVSLTTCIGVYLWSKSVGLTLVIGMSMILSMVIAALAGAAVPIVLTRAGQDPATASSIILTTVTDVCGFFSFLGIATLLSSML